MKFLESGDRKIDRWYEQEHYAKTDFSDFTEMFTNINTPEELSVASQNLNNDN